MNTKFVPAIEEPCPANWNDMQGDEKKRYCEHCKLHVHNLSAMTLSEQREVLSPGSTRKCISYLTRTDAQTVDAESWLKIQSASWVPRWLAAIVTVFTSSCTQIYRTTGTPPLPPPSTSAKDVRHDVTRMTGTPLAPKQPHPWGRRMLGKLKIIKE